MCDVVILGAGPAGLVAAADAARRGATVTVVEREPTVGGMAASFEVAGVRVDHGSHRFHPAASEAALARVRSLLGDDLQERPRNGRLRLGDRWLSFPLRTTELLAATPPSFAVGAVVDVVASPLRRPRADTYAQVVRAGLGPTVADRFHLPYARKLWGVDPEELSGELARRRVSAGSPMAIVRRLATTRRGRRPEFLYPRGGFGQIVERLADDAVEAGATIELGTEVTGLEGGVVRTAAGAERRPDHLWSTIPPSTQAKLVGAPPEITAAAERVRFRGLVLVYLVIERPQWTPFDAHYIADDANPVARLSEPKNYRDAADLTDRTVLCAEVPATVGDERWRASTEDLRALVVEALRREGLPDPGPGATEVRRLPRVYPVLTPSALGDLAALARWEAEDQTVVAFGRPALAVPDNTHHVIDMGTAIAGCLGADGTFDRRRWASARAAFAEHVVED